MNKYKCTDGTCCTIDLDDPTITSFINIQRILPTNVSDWGVHELKLRCIEQLGYAHVFMNYIWSEKCKTQDGGQSKRLIKLCNELREMNTSREENIQKWRAFLFRIEDEFENF